MRRTDVQLTPGEALRLIDYICELVEFGSKTENIIRLANENKYKDLDHYIGAKVQKELLRLNLVEPGQEGKLNTK